MDFLATFVIGIISMVFGSTTSDTGHGNLQPLGLEVPSVANCDSEAAPDQYHILLALVSTTSFPEGVLTSDFNVPAKTPAEYVLTITYVPFFIFHL